MIKLENISHTYKKSFWKGFKRYESSTHALHNINFEVKKGDIFGIIGLSGAGKSTLIRCINLLENPTEGRVLIEGTDLKDLSKSELRKRRKDIGMIFQHFNLLNSLNVRDNIALPLSLAGHSRKDQESRVDELLSLVGLEDKGLLYPANLSGGQKQRVAIARALSTKPKVLLCDEATSALDPETTRSILALLKEINTDLGVTIVLITHEMDVIKQICHKVAMISKGEIIEESSKEEFFKNPKSLEARRFLHGHTLDENHSEDLLPPLQLQLS